MLRILAIDDSRIVHAFLKDCVEAWPLEACVESAKDGREAVERFRQGGAAPDLILLDWEMPNLTGPETFEALRALGVTTPVMMLTSKNDVADISRMLEAGVADYVMKPFTSDLLLERVQAVLGA